MMTRKVSEIMTPHLKTVAPESTLQEAARLMAAADVGWLPVIDMDRRLVGTVTDRDIVIRSVAKGSSPRGTLVRDAMTSGVISARNNHSVEDVARLMQDNQVRRIVIVDAESRPVGVVSIGDVAQRTDEQRMVYETMEQVAAPV